MHVNECGRLLRSAHTVAARIAQKARCTAAIAMQAVDGNTGYHGQGRPGSALRVTQCASRSVSLGPCPDTRNADRNIVRSVGAIRRLNEPLKTSRSGGRERERESARSAFPSHSTFEASPHEWGPASKLTRGAARNGLRGRNRHLGRNRRLDQSRVHGRSRVHDHSRRHVHDRIRLGRRSSPSRRHAYGGIRFGSSSCLLGSLIGHPAVQPDHFPRYAATRVEIKREKSEC